VNNDANVAALAEARAGAGRDVCSIVMYTLGTGVGGGIVVDGKLIAGCSGMGGELGHMPIVPDLEAIQCGCGKMGCLETVASATGIVRMAEDAVKRGDATVLGTLETVSAYDVVNAARDGDEVAQRIVSRAAYYLGKSMAVVSVIINPDRFVIGGGVSKAGEFLLSQVRESFRKCALEKAQEGVEIVAAELGNSAGVIGAAMLMRDV
jgi:glucokinase